MAEMKVKGMVFSPTGGTLRVYEHILSAFAGQTVTDLCQSQLEISSAFCQGELCIVAVPSYGGRMPQIAKARIQQIQGHGAYAILLCVYGNRAYEDTLIELQDVMVTQGFIPIAGIVAVAEHSIFHAFASSRPDDKDKQELTLFCDQIKARMQSSIDGRLQVPGQRPYKTLATIPMIPQVNEHCSLCGYCATMCPVKAISFENPTFTDGSLCISCMRCVSICPKHARTIDPIQVREVAKKLAPVCEKRKDNECIIIDL